MAKTIFFHVYCSMLYKYCTIRTIHSIIIYLYCFWWKLNIYFNNNDIFFVARRYIYVCHAPVARTWCTMPRVLKCVAWISVMASLHQSTRFVDRTYEPIKISWRGQDSVVVCRVSILFRYLVKKCKYSIRAVNMTLSCIP